jgi:hypothetical protein
MGVAILPEGVVNRHRRMLKVKPLTREAVRSQVGIAVIRDSSDPLRDNLIALAKRVVKQ